MGPSRLRLFVLSFKPSMTQESNKQFPQQPLSRFISIVPGFIAFAAGAWSIPWITAFWKAICLVTFETDLIFKEPPVAHNSVSIQFIRIIESVTWLKRHWEVGYCLMEINSIFLREAVLFGHHTLRIWFSGPQNWTPAFGVKFYWNYFPDIPADVTDNTTENFKRYWYTIYDWKKVYSLAYSLMWWLGMLVIARNRVSAICTTPQPDLVKSKAVLWSWSHT